MDNQADADHCSVIHNIVDFWKEGDTGLSILRSCNSAPVTLAFDSKGKRNQYFDALVLKVAAHVGPTV